MPDFVTLFDFDAADLARDWASMGLYTVFRGYQDNAETSEQELYGFLIGAIVLCNDLIHSESTANLAKEIQRDIINLANRLRGTLGVPKQPVVRGSGTVPPIPTGGNS